MTPAAPCRRQCLCQSQYHGACAGTFDQTHRSILGQTLSLRRLCLVGSLDVARTVPPATAKFNRECHMSSVTPTELYCNHRPAGRQVIANQRLHISCSRPGVAAIADVYAMESPKQTSLAFTHCSHLENPEECTTAHWLRPSHTTDVEYVVHP